MAKNLMNYDDLKEELDLLVIDGRRSFDPTGKYDIEAYEKYIKENARIIGLLAKQVRDSLYLLKDERIIRQVLQNSKHYLIKAFDESFNKKPKIEYENSHLSNAEYVERCCKQNKYIGFISDDNVRYTRSIYSKIIQFMNKIYGLAFFSKEANNPDSKVLYDIFNNTKKACASLGIHSPNAEALYNYMTRDDLDEYEGEFDEDEFGTPKAGQNENVIFPYFFIPKEFQTPDPFYINIISLPYYVTIPIYKPRLGVIEAESIINDNTEFLINKTYKPKYNAK